MARVRLEIVSATEAHAVDMAPRMRQADREEVMASGGREPLPALLRAVRVSDQAWTALFDEVPACMWGVVTVRPGSVLSGPRTGCAWLLTTDLVDRYRKTFYSAGREELSRLLRVWPALVNVVDARHETSLRWAERLGFKVGEPRIFGYEQRPFRAIRRVSYV